MEKSNATIEEAMNEFKEAKAAFGKLSAKAETKVATSYYEHISNIKGEIANVIEKGWNDIKTAARGN
ncbi:MAG: hypothetical protein ACKO96_26180, partial [Flammeovirgaceae bacterium]